MVNVRDGNVDNYLKLEGTVEQTIRDEMGPIIGMFTVRSTPEGDAPLEVRNEFVNVRFPIREQTLEAYAGPRVYRDSETGNYRYEADRESIPVLGRDAILALREADHAFAADWWQDRLSPVTPLLFWASEGDLTLHRADQD